MKTVTIQFHPMDDVNYDELLKVVPDHALNPRLYGRHFHYEIDADSLDEILEPWTGEGFDPMEFVEFRIYDAAPSYTIE